MLSCYVVSVMYVNGNDPENEQLNNQITEPSINIL